MKLIDADALIDGYKNMGYDPCEHPEESYMAGWCNGFNSGVEHCTHHAIHAPTIEERKKGKWIDTTQGDHYKCSCCGTRAAFWFNEENSSGWERDMSEWLSDYCPNCGAKMDKE